MPFDGASYGGGGKGGSDDGGCGLPRFMALEMLVTWVAAFWLSVECAEALGMFHVVADGIGVAIATAVLALYVWVRSHLCLGAARRRAKQEKGSVQ